MTQTIFDEMLETIQTEKKQTPRPALNQDGGKLDVAQYLVDNGRDVVKQKAAPGGGTMFCLDACVFDPNHGPNEAAIIQADSGRLSYQCFHESCKGRTWADARHYISGDEKLGRWMVGGNGKNHVSPNQARSAAEWTPKSCAKNGTDFKDAETIGNAEGEENLSSASGPMPDIVRAVQPASDFAVVKFLPRPSLIDPIIGSQTYHLWSGAEGIGKTLFSMSAALALTGWKSFGPWPVVQRARVLYIDGELTGSDIQERWTMLDPEWHQRDNLFIYSNMHATGDLGLPPAVLYCEKWRDDMFKILVHLRIEVVFIDNIMSLSDETDINKFELWAPVNSWALRLRAAGCTPLMLHHLGKSGDQLGTKAREINVDMSARFERPPNYDMTQGADFIFYFKKHRLKLEKLSAIRPRRFTLINDQPTSRCTWSFEKPEDEINFKALALMVDEKTSIRGIARALGIKKNQVERIRTKAIERNIITDKKGLMEWTQSGFTEKEKWSK